MNPSDDQGWMAIALHVATNSQDPSTQNGAVLVCPTRSWYVLRHNAWPPGVTGTWERPDKYHYVEHAERAVVYAAARNGHMLNGTTMYCPWAACSDCSRAIVMAGIARLVRLPFNEDDVAQGSRWGESCRIGDDIMRQGGVRIDEIKLDTPVGIQLRRDGQLLDF